MRSQRSIFPVGRRVCVVLSAPSDETLPHRLPCNDRRSSCRVCAVVERRYSGPSPTETRSLTRLFAAVRASRDTGNLYRTHSEVVRRSVTRGESLGSGARRLNATRPACNSKPGSVCSANRRQGDLNPSRFPWFGLCSQFWWFWHQVRWRRDVVDRNEIERGLQAVTNALCDELIELTPDCMNEIHFEIVSTEDGGADIALRETPPAVQNVVLSPDVYNCCSNFLPLVKSYAPGWRRSLITLQKADGTWNVTMQFEYK